MLDVSRIFLYQNSRSPFLSVFNKKQTNQKKTKKKTTTKTGLNKYFRNKISHHFCGNSCFQHTENAKVVSCITGRISVHLQPGPI